MRAMRQERCANWRRISLRASSTMARYAYTAPVRMPNSRYLRDKRRENHFQAVKWAGPA